MIKNIVLGLGIFGLIIYFYFSTLNADEMKFNNSITDISENIEEIELAFTNIDKIIKLSIDEELLNIEKKKSHIKTPKNVKSLYFSANSINNETKFNNFLKIAEEKEINSIMIDLKEVDGYITLKLDESYFTTIKPVSNNRIKNIEEIIKKLHNNNIYIIGRIAVFKDNRLPKIRPDLAVKWLSNGQVWTDFKGNRYSDQYSKEVWNYHAEIGIAAYDLGFDEINYDYIRFPTDGYITNTYYPFAKELISKNSKWGKVMVIDEFSNYITTKLRDYNSDIVISADVFGLVTDYTMFNIGQNLESFLLSFDYVGPMIYPSHYGEGYYGYKYPDNNPYGVIKIALNNAVEKINNLKLEIKNAGIDFRGIKFNDDFIYNKQGVTVDDISINKIRPYLQGFSCTRCNNYTLYNRSKFREAVDGVNDIGIDSWWVWSAGSYYRPDRYNENN